MSLTDIRAALREAASTLNTLARRSESSDHHPLVDPDLFYHASGQYRALADAPPTVAELLPMVDATHEVRWTDRDGDEWCAIHVDSDGGPRIAIEMRSRDEQDIWWFTHYPLASDFLLPGCLVEVSP